MRHFRPIDSAPRAFTLMEVTIAMTISVMAMVGMVTTYTMAARFLAQGMIESRLIYKGAITIEKMTRTLNHAYRNDAIIASHRFAIAADHKAITFSRPNDIGGVERYRYRFDAADKKLYYEIEAGSSFSNVGGAPFQKDVAGFVVENQEGIISLALTLNVDLKRNGNKHYTIVGRALPRNL